MVRLLLVVSLACAWPIDKIDPAVARLTVVDGSCTAFRIHAERWVTAAHCLTSGIVGATVGGHPVLEILEQQDGDLGLGVVKVEKTKGPKIQVAFARRGTEVLLTGYGGGAPAMLVFPALVQLEAVDLNGEAQTYSSPGIPGMSGGPVVDRQGRVTGVLVGSFKPTSVDVLIGFGPTHQAVKKFIERWD